MGIAEPNGAGSSNGTGGRAHSGLERMLRGGAFVVTAELSALDSPDPEAVVRMAEPLLGRVDAVNCTDNPGAHTHLSALAAAHIVQEMGLEANVQFACRDRNRLALQADILGAAALGIRNVTMMTGDDVSAGDHPEAKAVYDLDSMHLLRIARIMRDQGTYLSGRKLAAPPSYFIGAVENPFAPPLDFRPHRLMKKIDAGAEFVQTQIVFNVPRFRSFMAAAADLGALERAFVVPSLSIPRSARGARFMQAKVPGLDVPDAVVRRLEGVPPERQQEEGLRIALEVFEEVRGIPGISGVHFIAIKWEEGIARAIDEAGLLPRPRAMALADGRGS